MNPYFDELCDTGSARSFNPFTRDIAELDRLGTVPLAKRRDESSLVYGNTTNILSPNQFIGGWINQSIEQSISVSQSVNEVSVNEKDQ